MTDKTLASYEQVPYESTPVPGSHPDSLASMATLFGLSPPPVDTCRVLELGCATGSNVIAIADSVPNCRCIGIDLSPSHVASGQELVRSLDLRNIELRAGSILDIDASWGTFDYIICHGVWSWVPPAVQDHIFTVCSQNLARHGVAYVSYNVYPGWHIAGMIRDMVHFHGRHYADPHQRLAEVRNFLDFLTKLVGNDPENTLYSQLLANQVADMQESGDSYVFHEYLEDFNQPVYFQEFMRRAAAAGLQFLSECSLSMMVGTLSADIKNTLHGWSKDIIEYEQYLDFVRNRRFRRTLLCHADEDIQRQPDPAIMRRVRLSTRTQPSNATADPAPTAGEKFHTVKGVSWTTNNPWMRTAARVLAAVSPRSLPYVDLAARVRSALPPGVEPDEERLLQALLQGVLTSLFECHVVEPVLAATVSERPVASPLSRLQVQRNGRVTSRRHESFAMDALHCRLIAALDGTRDRAALLQMLIDQVNAGMPLRDEKHELVQDPPRVRELLTRGLDQALTRLARNGLLIA